MNIELQDGGTSGWVSNWRSLLNSMQNFLNVFGIASLYEEQIDKYISSLVGSFLINMCL